MTTSNETKKYASDYILEVLDPTICCSEKLNQLVSMYWCEKDDIHTYEDLSKFSFEQCKIIVDIVKTNILEELTKDGHNFLVASKIATLLTNWGLDEQLVSVDYRINFFVDFQKALCSNLEFTEFDDNVFKCISKHLDQKK